MFVICCLVFGVLGIRCLLLFVCYVLFVVCCSLLVASCLLIVDC